MLRTLMKKYLPLVIVSLLLCFGLLATQYITQPQISGAPPYGEPERNVPDIPSGRFQDWRRPNGPAKVGLQVGHWHNDQLPEELSRLIGNTGAQGGGKMEWEVNHEIAQRTKTLLEAEGVVVDLLPATVPPEYWADAFIAIHADGSTNPNTSGFKMAAPWRDLTGNADQLVSLLEQEYQSATNLRLDPNITRNMRGYYAFSWWRYKHAIHPMTTAAIVETGFLTSPADRKLIVDQPEVSARALATAILKYLAAQQVLSQPN